jgi:hypothetical protein
MWLSLSWPVHIMAVSGLQLFYITCLRRSNRKKCLYFFLNFKKCFCSPLALVGLELKVHPASCIKPPVMHTWHVIKISNFTSTNMDLCRIFVESFEDINLLWIKEMVPEFLWIFFYAPNPYKVNVHIFFCLSLINVMNICVSRSIILRFSSFSVFYANNCYWKFQMFSSALCFHFCQISPSLIPVFPFTWSDPNGL